MIRREISSADGTKMWLLVSQVHHAQVSGELARYWHEQFSADVIEAITHHDDGWSNWEADPKLNPENGRPYSFLEMPLAEALEIWDRSIASARDFGPLGGYIVAGHFYNLLNDSDHASEGAAIAWLAAKRKVRTTWIDEWVRSDPSHTLDYAKRAQQLLPLADLFSLWLCCDCPLEEDQESILTQSPMKRRTDSLLGQYDFTVLECLVGKSQRSERITGIAWTVAVDPYPFRETLPTLTLKAIIAPARHYANWAELLESSGTVELQWQLVPSNAAADSAA